MASRGKWLLTTTLVIGLFGCSGLGKMDLKGENELIHERDSLQELWSVLVKDGDGDGVPDWKDACPLDQSKSEPGFCGCGTPDTDSDGDGLMDCQDFVQMDTDGDGVPDELDKCPGLPGLPEDRGCPAENVGNPASPTFNEMVAEMQRAYPNEAAALGRSGTTVVRVTDTLVIGAANRPGRIVYYCPSQLRELQRGEIIVTLGELMADTVLRKRLVTQVNKRQARLNETLITENDLLTGDVRLSDLMYVHLKGDTSFFTIQKNHLRDTVSTTDGGVDEWRWTISPKEGMGGLRAVIDIVVVALDAEGKPLYSDEQVFPVQIDLKQNIWEAAWTAMGRDPKWTVTTIAIPLITFLFGRWSARRKAKGVSGTDPDKAA